MCSLAKKKGRRKGKSNMKPKKESEGHRALRSLGDGLTHLQPSQPPRPPSYTEPPFWEEQSQLKKSMYVRVGGGGGVTRA